MAGHNVDSYDQEWKDYVYAHNNFMVKPLMHIYKHVGMHVRINICMYVGTNLCSIFVYMYVHIVHMYLYTHRHLQTVYVIICMYTRNI